MSININFKSLLAGRKSAVARARTSVVVDVASMCLAATHTYTRRPITAKPPQRDDGGGAHQTQMQGDILADERGAPVIELVRHHIACARTCA